MLSSWTIFAAAAESIGQWLSDVPGIERGYTPEVFTAEVKAYATWNLGSAVSVTLANSGLKPEKRSGQWAWRQRVLITISGLHDGKRVKEADIERTIALLEFYLLKWWQKHQKNKGVWTAIDWNNFSSRVVKRDEPKRVIGQILLEFRP